MMEELKKKALKDLGHVSGMWSERPLWTERKESMTIGENIRTIRKQKGLTQEELASKTGLIASTIRKYESGKISPKSDNLQKIASALGVSPSQIDERLKEMIRQKTNLSAFTTDELLEEIKRKCR